MRCVSDQKCDKIICFCFLNFVGSCSLKDDWLKRYTSVRNVEASNDGEESKTKEKKERKRLREQINDYTYIKYLRVYLQNIYVSNARMLFAVTRAYRVFTPKQNIDVNN